jgi:hypothetical protein
MKPGVKTLIGGAVIFIIGAAIIPLAIVLPLLLAKNHDTRFKVPGIQKVTINKPGKYYLWNNYQTVYQGHTYNRSEKVPDGYDIKITDANGAPLTLESDGSITITENGASKDEIGYVDITSPGLVTIQVSGGTEERIFSFSQSDLFKIVGRIFAGAGVAVLFGFTGIGIMVWGIVKLTNSGK